ncbi:GNAT family N-acetyltransferase [Endozoicomonadaceae bacterium StTr2]
MFETARLKLREFDTDDASFLYELMNSPLYIKNIGDRNIKSVQDAETFLVNKLISSYQEHGYGLYAVELKDTGQVIGMSGLVRREGLEHADIGFGFLPDYMGQGYAYEASEAVMKFARDELALDPVLAITIKENDRSIKLLNKLGLKHSQPIEWNGEEILLLSTSSQTATV